MTKSKARIAAEEVWQSERYYFQWSACGKDYHVQKRVMFRMLEEAYKLGRKEEKERGEE